MNVKVSSTSTLGPSIRSVLECGPSCEATIKQFIGCDEYSEKQSIVHDTTVIISPKKVKPYFVVT
ncbi:hypothetical protein WH47_07329 [Habropoda laboriosa]|uniref:Uncharacterized protein n=1 Tax=Habropoda laboriosa TaxID=597456 RepID=A0A0L7R5V8_9HYME|nr:hypothetical protein WH47_07329 [Habropoda laboriosa]